MTATLFQSAAPERFAWVLATIAAVTNKDRGNTTEFPCPCLGSSSTPTPDRRERRLRSAWEP